MALRLYANSLSPFVRKVRIALYEKGVDFDAVEIDSGSRRAELLRINPRGEVPALVDDDTVVTGSSAICDYLEDTFPQPALLPSDPAERARCKSFEYMADTHTDVLQFFSFLFAVRRPELRERYAAAPLMVADAVRRHYVFLDRQLGGRDHFVRELSRADVAFVPHLTSLAHLGEPIPDGCASLRRWLGHMLERPSVQRDAAQALSAWEAAATNPDPFFRTDRIHWRGERVEWAVRLGLGTWLVGEVEAGRAYFSPAPDAVPSAA
jgi:glutathione S-transferase